MWRVAWIVTCGGVVGEVWDGMWHDFIEHSTGCGSGSSLHASVDAAPQKPTAMANTPQEVPKYWS